MTKRSPFKYFKTSSEVIRLAVMMYIRFPLSLRTRFILPFSPVPHQSHHTFSRSDPR